MSRNHVGFLVLLCRLIVGGVFIYASLDKLQNPEAFALVIHHYRMVPYSMLHSFTMFLPLLELIAGVALVLGFRQRGALSRGLDISCGCFNTDGGHEVGLSLLLRDALLLLACLPPLFSLAPGPGISNLLKR